MPLTTKQWQAVHDEQRALFRKYKMDAEDVTRLGVDTIAGVLITMPVDAHASLARINDAILVRVREGKVVLSEYKDFLGNSAN